MAESKIEWTEMSWNPIAGCSKCSPGCLNCYAEKMAARLAHMGQRKYQDVVEGNYNNWFLPEWNGDIVCDESSLDIPLHWRKPRKIFVCSMSDLFHPKVPFEFIDKVLHRICQASHHTYQVLTKRPKRMMEFFNRSNKHFGNNYLISDHIWLGTSISTPDEMWKAEVLSRIPAAVRYISFEPLLADVGEMTLTSNREDDTNLEEFGQHIDWIIVGAESKGRGVGRPCKTEWIDSIVEQCKAANVPVFVKQINVNGKLVKMPEQYPQEMPK